VATNMLEGLVRYKPGTWELENVLAESIEQVDDVTIEFTLREGVQFHQGYGELTAEDVKYTFERVAGLTEPPLDSPYRGDWAALDNVEVTGTYSGIIHLKEPFAALWTTTLPVFSSHILSKKAVEELGNDAMATNPVGTGPYVIQEWRPNEIVILERFPDYWGTPPEWDEIHILPIVEDSAAEIAFETGEADYGPAGLVTIDRFEQNPDFDVYQFNSLGYYWVGMNVQHPNLTDINIRQAIRYAIDVPSILTAAYDDRLVRGCSLIAPGLVGYWADAPCYDRDVDLALEYLAQAESIPTDLTITITTAEDDRTAAEVVQANLAEIGLDLEIIAQDPSAFYDGGFGEPGLTQRQLVYISYTNFPDPSWATVWFTCDQVGEWNWMYWCSEEFDALHDAALIEQDPDKRAEMYIEMQQIWDEAVHTVWVAFGTNYFVSRTDLNPGVMPHGIALPFATTSK